MQWSDFNLLFQIGIYHLIANNNCQNVVPLVLLLCSDTPGGFFEEEQPCIIYVYELQESGDIKNTVVLIFPLVSLRT